MIENLPNEEWRPIEGYPNYEVSNKGRIKSLPRKTNNQYGKKEHLLSKHLTNSGYYTSTTDINGKTVVFNIHRLEAFAFLSIPEHLKDIPIENLVINHKDENKENDDLENLEICTQQYNCKYGTKIERFRKKRSKQVYQYSLDYKLIKIWPSFQECFRNGFSTHIHDCCNGKRKTHKGFIWSYTPLN